MTDRPEAGHAPRLLVVAGNTFANKGDAALTLALAGELERQMPEAVLTWSLRAPRLAVGLGGRTIGQPLAPWAPGTRRILSALGAIHPALPARAASAWLALLGPRVRLAVRLPRLARLIARRELRGAIALIREADAVIAMPGGYLLADDPRQVDWIWALAPLVIANALRVPTILASCSIGPLPPVQRGAATRILRRARLIQLREGRSAVWAESLGAPRERTAVVPDLAWLIAPADRLPEAVDAEIRAAAAAGGPLVGIVVRDAPARKGVGREVGRDALVRAFAELADRLVEERGARIVFGPQALVGPVSDVEIAHRVVRRMRHPEAASVVAADLDPAQLATLYGRLRLLVTVRMHAGILAMTAGTPCVAVGYGLKHTGTMEGLGIGDLVLPLEGIEEGRLSALVTGALDREAELRALLAQRTPEQRSGAREAVARIRDTVLSAPSPRRRATRARGGPR